MTENSKTIDVEKIVSFNGIDIYLLNIDKFKTCTINVYFIDNLNKDYVSKNAIIPYIIKRGSEKYPNIQKVNNYLQEMYGSTFECAVSKKGEFQIMQFYIDYVSEKYLDKKIDMIDKIGDFLEEIFLKPKLENSEFDKNYVEGEKDNLKRLIDSRINDKNHYAIERCFDEMCKDELYSINEYGVKDDIDKLDESSLYEHYKNYFLKKLPIKVFISGDVDKNKIDGIINIFKKIERKDIVNIEYKHSIKKSVEVSEITEKIDVNQGKLSIGFRTNIFPTSDDIFKLTVYNGILGGGIHSKLFNNVREKESLAYYAFSMLEKYKGLQMISSGIEIKNKEKAYNIIMKQIEDIKNGKISEYEFEATIKSLVSGCNYLKDSQLGIIEFYLGQYLIGRDDSIETYINKYKSVTMEEVVEISNKIKLDTVYFLTSKE